MSVARGQQQTFLRLLRALRPHWHRDLALPARFQALLARHKEFGSRDRRLYRELVYTTLRYLPWIEPLLDTDPDRAAATAAWLAADTRDTSAYRQALCGDWPVADTLVARASFLGQDSSRLLPSWFRDECPAVFESPELDAQLARAPLWLRLQTADTASVMAEFESRRWTWEPSPVLQTAWQLLSEADVTRTGAFAHGAVEVQDLGSQLVLESVGVAEGGRWFDACAGAGGKTLHLARLLGAAGQVHAFDVRAAALEELQKRAARAGAFQVQVVSGPDGAGYDGVLIDAPCSGSGTWRRAPHLKWATTPAIVASRAALQKELLEQYAGSVRPGGSLVYATCSLARTENNDVIASFLARHPEFTVAPHASTFGFEPGATGVTIMPHRHNSDGFFVSILRRSR